MTALPILDRQAMVALRPATIADAPFLLALRNDPVVRANSASTRMITPTRHQRWLKDALSDRDRRVYIATAAQSLAMGAIGTGRLIRDSDTVEFSVALLAASRGHGFGTALIAALVTEAQGLGHAGIAKIRSGNTASLIAFLRNGFQPWTMESRGWVVLRRALR